MLPYPIFAPSLSPTWPPGSVELLSKPTFSTPSRLRSCSLVVNQTNPSCSSSPPKDYLTCICTSPISCNLQLATTLALITIYFQLLTTEVAIANKEDAQRRTSKLTQSLYLSGWHRKRTSLLLQDLFSFLKTALHLTIVAFCKIMCNYFWHFCRNNFCIWKKQTKITNEMLS